MIPIERARWARLVLGGLVVGGAVARSSGDVTLPNSPAAYRLQNNAVADPRTAGCSRGTLPPYNRGCWLNNPRGTGIDDPWRPPKVWPETRYPVVPAYTRPSFGYFDTSWRVLNVCGDSPYTRTPPLPAPTVFPPAPVQRPAAGKSPADVNSPGGPNPPAGGNPTEQNPPRAVPPRAVPPKATTPEPSFQPRTNEGQPAPTLPRANVPKAGELDTPAEFPTRAAMAEPDEFSTPTMVLPQQGQSTTTVHAF
jgi:hypothetical protein